MAVDSRLLPIDPFGFFGFNDSFWATSFYSPPLGYVSSGSPSQVVPASITTSAELPGSTHWDPATIPVGQAGGGGGGTILGIPEGASIPWVDILGPGWWPSGNTDQSPAEYVPPPILLPGQTDPGREEHEEEDEEMAHTWTHLGSQFISALFPNEQQNYGTGFVAGPGQVAGGQVIGPNGPVEDVVGPGVQPGMISGSCAAPKTRTLTIDCATGLEVKRKRRRRRALLTQGDMGVLFQIASLPNNANVRVALAGAIRR